MNVSCLSTSVSRIIFHSLLFYFAFALANKTCARALWRIDGFSKERSVYTPKAFTVHRAARDNTAQVARKRLRWNLRVECLVLKCLTANPSSSLSIEYLSRYISIFTIEGPSGLASECYRCILRDPVRTNEFTSLARRWDNRRHSMARKYSVVVRGSLMQCSTFASLLDH